MSDVYAVGCIIYQMITGELPSNKELPMFDHETFHLPGIGSLLADLLQKLLSQDPEVTPSAMAAASFVDDIVKHI